MQSMHEIEPQVKKRGPLWRLDALLSMGFWISPSPRLPLSGRPSLSTGKRGDHFQRSPLCRYMRATSHSPLRLPLRGWLPLSLRAPVSPKGRDCPPQRRLRVWRFADIPTAPPGQNIKGVVVTLSIFSASLALDACAIASALAPQRFFTTSATAPVAPAPQSIPGSALAPQHLALNRLLTWRSA